MQMCRLTRKAVGTKLTENDYVKGKRKSSMNDIAPNAVCASFHGLIQSNPTVRRAFPITWTASVLQISQVNYGEVLICKNKR